MKEVITITWITKESIGNSKRLNNSPVIYVDNIIIATFTKLFEIRIVASNRFGTSNNLIIKNEDFVFFDSNSFSWACFNEKKAISEPEIIAEQNKRKISIIIPIIAPKEKGFNNTTTAKVISYNKCPISVSSKIF